MHSAPEGRPDEGPNAMRLYLNLKNGIAEIEASETPLEGFDLYELTPVDTAPHRVAPKRPRRVPGPPDGCVYYGPGPLAVPAGEDQFEDVLAFTTRYSTDEWDAGYSGLSTARDLHYALRRGTSIAKANGIPDTP